MSNLSWNDDDHPEAAAKHLHDAEVLLHAARFDGAGYLSGYVVECALKTVFLFDQVMQHGTTCLTKAHRQVAMKPFGHNLAALAALTFGPHGAQYMPDLSLSPSVVQRWKETIRYRCQGTIKEDEAVAWYWWASFVYAESVLRMRLDGVL
ncbi:hypothetical protein [Pendulispora albinea]|uniref:HEPN domain-containing protein n=1 Tax=Pendulispora albinea TaxID=2741071 RepID=A0ABZ2LUE2_9BACT